MLCDHLKSHLRLVIETSSSPISNDQEAYQRPIIGFHRVFEALKLSYGRNEAYTKTESEEKTEKLGMVEEKGHGGFNFQGRK